MDVRRVLVQRRMVRSFDGSKIDADLVTGIFEDSLRVPTAGNSQGISWIVLVGENETTPYFETTTDSEWRARSRRYEGLKRASAIGVCLVNPSDYVARYSEPDKSASGLGEGLEEWPVPYWIGDAGASCLAALMLIEEEGLDGCFLGAFRGVERLHETLSIPDTYLIYGAVLLGRGDGNGHRSASLDRPQHSRTERTHRRVF